MSGLEKVYQFLDEVHTYYLATVEGDQPRVRAFGTALLYDGKLYIQTGKVKPVSKQIAANPKVEICAFKGGKWLRIAGELVNDDNRDVKVAMLDKMPSLKPMYSADDDNMQMLYFKNATATFSSFTEEPEVIEF
ncbi:MAG: pyridoxamine 5'-phosphate oxidase family protein [Ruminococcus sp.]|nr:pyridoxamine 5'-phosphate oxidase family protein [Ruminococcus sp.]MBQ7504735.1 pyridoxamine 5'-phosphate oxidase family protein [Ruminococcus sp.]